MPVLDPLADGLLIVAIGRVATRELSVFGQLPNVTGLQEYWECLRIH